MKSSVSQITTVAASFADDVRAYAAAGLDAIGIWEFKLGDDAADRDLVRRSGLGVSHCVPAVPSILPLPLMEGPADPAERVEAICASVRRLAAFEPACVLFLTGPGEDRDTVLEGIRRIAEEGERSGVRVALEPVQRKFAEYWTIPTTFDGALSLLEEASVSAAGAGVMVDSWHLWNDDGLLPAIERHTARIAGVHVADWREPTRNTNDRVFPGDGVAPLGQILTALDRAGYDGYYDVEIFSDTELEDSLWTLPASEAATRALESLERVWAAREG